MHSLFAATKIFKQLQRISAFKKLSNIARNIMCFIRDVIFAKQKFSDHPIYPPGS